MDWRGIHAPNCNTFTRCNSRLSNGRKRRIALAPSSPLMGEVVAKRPEGVMICNLKHLDTPPVGFADTLPIKGRERRPAVLPRSRGEHCAMPNARRSSKAPGIGQATFSPLAGEMSPKVTEGGVKARCFGRPVCMVKPPKPHPPVTRQMTSPTSSATSSEPSGPIATPTGRPQECFSSGDRKPVRMSRDGPDGLPFSNGTKMTR